MSKKRSRRKKAPFPKGWRASPRQVEAWLTKTEGQLMDGRNRGAAQTARRVLRHVPKGAKPHGEALRLLGTALAVLQEFEESYQVLSEALEAQPEDASVWYNRGLAARFTTRMGQSLLDLERAVELEQNPQSRKVYEEELMVARKLIALQLAQRSPGFTLNQLIEQQETFMRGIELMSKKQWAEAEAIFRQVIEMGDVPPQPWGNLAGCLIMQERYDEAEDALRRALEIEPDYEVARQNLELLPTIRQHGPSVMGTRIKAPFEGREIKQDIMFVR